jgi:hypothetical protein
MIDFVEGKIYFGERGVLITSHPVVWSSLAEEGLVEIRTSPAGGTAHFYAEVMTDGMRFGVTVCPRQEKIDWLVLHWLDGPCTSKGWDGVSEEALRQEYRLLLRFLQMAAGSPDEKSERQRTWYFKWGRAELCYQPRDFVAAIFMTPRRRR